MFNNNTNNSITLNPGELYISTDRKTIRMILGTCVSVVLYSSKYKTGAICHAQLPEKKSYSAQCSEGCPVPCHINIGDGEMFKYVVCSVRYMVDTLNAKGIKNSELISHVIGGASVIENSTMGAEIARNNIAVAHKMLRNLGIPVVSSDTGGILGRKMAFEMESGKLTVQFISVSKI